MSRSPPMGDETRGEVPKDDNEVSSLTESVSGLDQRLVFEL